MTLQAFNQMLVTEGILEVEPEITADDILNQL